MGNRGWIGVDLDGTLARYEGWDGGKIGAPIPEMVQRVKEWQAEGKDVRIVTARVQPWESASPGDERARLYVTLVQPIVDWCLLHLNCAPRVTCMKDFGMIELWDDRCVAVEKNTGRILGIPLGATGNFPDGIDHPSDEGELRIAMAADIVSNLVRIDFGKPVAWLALRKEDAEQIAHGLLLKAVQLK